MSLNIHMPPQDCIGRPCVSKVRSVYDLGLIKICFFYDISVQDQGSVLIGNSRMAK